MTDRPSGHEDWRQVPFSDPFVADDPLPYCAICYRPAPESVEEQP